MARRTAYRILKNIETRGSSKHAGKGKAGAKPSKLGPQKKRLLLKAAKGRVGASLRVLARRFGVSHQYVAKILQKNNIKYKKRIKAPEVTPEQKKRQKTRIKTAGPWVVIQEHRTGGGHGRRKLFYVFRE